MSDQCVTLEVEHFVPGPDGTGIEGEASELTDETLDWVVAQARRARTLSLNARLKDLARFADAHLRARNIDARQVEVGDFRFTHASERHLLRVLPFRPDHNVVHDLARDAGDAQVVSCLYTEPSSKEAEVVALVWALEAKRNYGTPPSELELKLWRQPGGPLP